MEKPGERIAGGTTKSKTYELRVSSCANNGNFQLDFLPLTLQSVSILTIVIRHCELRVYIAYDTLHPYRLINLRQNPFLAAVIAVSVFLVSSFF